MKNLLNKKSAVAAHFILQIIFLAYIAYAVHWSVALFLAWLSVSIYSINDGYIKHLEKIQEDYNRKIKAVRQDFQNMIAKAAETTVAKVVDEVEKQPHSHFMRPVPPRVNPERPRCKECMYDPAPGAVIYNQGNCPIHD